MPIEDVDANIRRNLVAVSAVVLISTYLDVPIIALAFDRLLNLENPIPPYKLIALGYAFLGYFSLRLAIQEGESKAGRQGREQMWKARKHWVRVWFDQEIREFAKTRVERGLFRGKLLDPVKQEAASHQIASPFDKWHLKLGIEAEHRSAWEPSFHVVVSWPSPSGPPVGGAFVVSVQVSRTRRVWVATRVWARWAFYTQVGMQTEFPALLCFAAQIALAYQLVRLA